MCRLLLLLPITFFMLSPAFAGEKYHAVHEFPLSGGLTQEHFSDFVQDKKGYVYIGTWDGIVRYDGYRFDTFRPDVDDVSTCRVLKMRIDEGGDIYCEMYNGSIYVFDTDECQFKTTKDDIPENWTENRSFKRIKRISPPDQLRSLYPQGEVYIKDRLGNIWIRGSRTLAMASVYDKNYVGMTPGAGLFIRAVYQTANGVIWQGSKNGHLLSGEKYVTPTGKLTTVQTTFSDKGIYSLYEDASGRILVGTRGDGLYRLTPQNGTYKVEHWKNANINIGESESYPLVSKDCLSGGGVYDITSDGNDGYYLATWGGGINHFADGSFTSTNSSKLRKVIRIDSMLVAASTDGLLIYDGDDHRQQCKGCDITAIVKYGSELYFFVYGKGLFSIPCAELMADSPTIKPFPAKGNALPKVVSAAIVEKDRLWLFSTPGIVRLSLTDSIAVMRYLPSSTHRLYISETSPALLADGRILLGTEQGGIIFDTSDSKSVKPQLPIIVTGVQHQGDDYVTPIHDADTLTIEPHERSFAIFLSTLDFKDAHKTRFIYRLEDVDEKWNYSSRANSIGFNGLQPGQYHLHIRAMSYEDGSVVSDRIIVVDVVPRFHETFLFKLIIVIILLLIASATVYTIAYIRRMHAKQRALEEYCYTLLAARTTSENHYDATHSDGSQEEQQTVDSTVRDSVEAERDIPSDSPVSDSPALSSYDKQMLDRFVEIFNLYMPESDKSLDDYASAMNMSYSSLYRKIKSLVGCSPGQFITRLRIQVAIELFDKGEQQVADVAYRVGFSDPKYFSKCFKAKTGLTPTKYIENKIEY